MVSETKTTEAPGLRRELKARHLTMIAIGGSIGTGLFVASGATISQAGPGGGICCLWGCICAGCVSGAAFYDSGSAAGGRFCAGYVSSMNGLPKSTRKIFGYFCQ